MWFPQDSQKKEPSGTCTYPGEETVLLNIRMDEGRRESGWNKREEMNYYKNKYRCICFLKMHKVPTRNLGRIQDVYTSTNTCTCR